MAFDDTTRNRLQRFVSVTRGILSEEFTRQLQQTYGMDPATGEVTEISGLKHLDDQRLETAHILRQIMDHYLATETAKGDVARRMTLDRIVREQAFTVLNRLAALRMMESRGILREAVGKGLQSQSFQLYQRVAGGVLGDTGETYRSFLFSLFDLFAIDLPGLFDRYSPQSRLFPRDTALAEVLEEINHLDLENLWAEDETIGWIYQYFNSKEERQAMRKASQAPRNSRELAVRNQFFTPRYVVEFLVDNTLGRLWFNWTGGATVLRDRCQYLHTFPNEQPEAVERLRDPRTIKLLDPACGSMHFGLYAFDLFLEIYREAWAWETLYGPGSLDIATQPETLLKPLTETYSDEASYLRDVPQLIIKYNIYGVEIDPRAAQIASLALWLRAQRSWHDAGEKAVDRPEIGRGNVIAAVAPPAEVDLRRELMAEMDDLDGELFEKTLLLLKGLPELGVLLQVDRELPLLIREVFGEHGGLFRKDDETQWQNAEIRLRSALTDFVWAARSTYQGRMFALDALDGLRLIDLTQELFDVIVMNPPFGENAKTTNSYLEKSFRFSKGNILAHFIERSEQILRPGGKLGAIVSRTCFFLQSFSQFRSEILGGRFSLETFADLGQGVLDAMVETAAVTWEKNYAADNEALFFRELNSVDKSSGILQSINLFAQGLKGDNYFQARTSQFSLLDGSPYVYWVDSSTIKKIADHPNIEPLACTIRVGLQTGNDFRFLRLWWEVQHDDIIVPNGDEGQSNIQLDCISQSQFKKWAWYSKTESALPVLSSIHLVVKWHKNGSEIKAYHEGNGHSASKYVRSESMYFRPGFSYMLRSSRIVPYIVPKGIIPTAGRSQVFPRDGEENWLMALLSSNLSTAVARFRGEAFWQPKFQNSMVASTPYLEAQKGDLLVAQTVLNSIRLQVAHTFSSDETEIQFVAPSTRCDSDQSFFLDRHSLIGRNLDCRIAEICGLSSSEFSELERDHNEALSPRRIIDEEESFAVQNTENSPPVNTENEQLSWCVGVVFGRYDWRLATGDRKSTSQPDPFHPLPTISPGMLNADAKSLHAKSDILVDDLGHPHDLAHLVEKVLVRVDCPMPDDLRRWLQRDFFPFHLKRYSKSRRKAPIYWPLTSSSGNYTLWVYYPEVTDQTLYTAANDYVGPKLEETAGLVAQIRIRTERSRDEERQLERLQDLETELKEMLAELLRLAPTWKPHYDDGVQITAAPLWRLFHHRPWQIVLKATWEKLDKGDYDWAYLAMSYWPDRVLEKCRTDKSLAIAHNLEDLYERTPE